MFHIIVRQIADHCAHDTGILPVDWASSCRGSADFGLIGLAVMGQNLILNAADHGFKVCAFNRTVAKVDKFLANEAKGEPGEPLFCRERILLTHG